jgi:glycosyltransferase involved in cell wall biosynthesis
MTVAIMSDSPTVTTGFGRTTTRIADALLRSGHDVVCFGFKATWADVAEAPIRVWPADQSGHWTWSLPGFLAATRPRLLVLNMDAYNAVECLDELRAAQYSGPVLSYVVFDGLPVGRYYLEAQRSCAAVFASSHTAAAYLRASRIPVMGVAPPGVDMTVFAPSHDRRTLRDRAGLTDAFVLGVFGRNTERKQIARVLSALPAIRTGLGGGRLVAYLHCGQNGYWRLADLADNWSLKDNVVFAGDSAFDEERGVQTAGRALRTATDATTRTWPFDLSYVDRINCCDVIVNAPHSGDVEQVILEAQACGVPLIHTDDEGVMTEAVGGAGVMLPARDIGTGRTGARQYHVAPDEIARAVLSLSHDPSRREALSRAGLANAARYKWSALEQGICAAVDVLLRRAGEDR